MKDLHSAWSEDAAIRGMAPVTIAKYAHALRMFDKFLQGGAPAGADKNDIRRYIEALRSRGLTQRSIARYLTALNSFYEYLIYEGELGSNPVSDVRKRYISRYKSDSENHTHRLISVEEAARLVNAIVDIQYKTLLLLLLKTGMRIGEALSLDVDSIRWSDQSILLKATKKRSNLIVFFDNEMEYYLKRWLAVREMRACNGSGPLFLTNAGKRIQQSRVYAVFSEAGIRTGLHDPASDRLEDHISSHCGRHFFSTVLLDAGMKREHVQWLRGDALREAIDTYHHIKAQAVRESYLAHVPQLGV